MSANDARKLSNGGEVRLKEGGYVLRVVRIYDKPEDPKIVLIEGLKNGKTPMTVTHQDVR
jgi:hypothetical protein